MASVFVRGSGGAFFEMDVPTRGQALELWEEKLRKGDLIIVTNVEWREFADGTDGKGNPVTVRRLVPIEGTEPEPEAEPEKPKRGRRAHSEAATGSEE